MRCWESLECEVEDSNQLQLGVNAEGTISAEATKALLLLGWYDFQVYVDVMNVYFPH